MLSLIEKSGGEAGEFTELGSGEDVYCCIV